MTRRGVATFARVLLVASGLGLFGAACSAFTNDASRPVENEAGIADAGQPDQEVADSAPGPASDAAAPSDNDACAYESPGANVVASEDFGGTGCDGWMVSDPEQASLTPMQLACGPACRYCATILGANNVGMQQTLSIDSPGPGSFTMKVWMIDQDAGAQAVFKTQTNLNDTGLLATLMGSGGFRSNWTDEVSGTMELDASVSSATVIITADKVDSYGCFMLANLRVDRTP